MYSKNCFNKKGGEELVSDEKEPYWPWVKQELGKGKVSRVKITVLKAADPKYVFGENIPIDPLTGKPYSPCPLLNEGQTFIISEKPLTPKKPEVFQCPEAWQDLFRTVAVLMYGGSYPWVEEGVAYTCCTDGTRPVTFKLERLKD